MKPIFLLLLVIAASVLWITATVRRRLAQTSFALLIELIEAVLWAYMVFVAASVILDPGALKDWSTFRRALLPVDGITGKQVVALLLGAGVGLYRFFERPFPKPPERDEIVRGRQRGLTGSHSKKPGLLERFRRFLHRLQQ